MKKKKEGNLWFPWQNAYGSNMKRRNLFWLHPAAFKVLQTQLERQINEWVLGCCWVLACSWLMDYHWQAFTSHQRWLSSLLYLKREKRKRQKKEEKWGIAFAYLLLLPPHFQRGWKQFCKFTDNIGHTRGSFSLSANIFDN